MTANERRALGKMPVEKARRIVIREIERQYRPLLNRLGLRIAPQVATTAEAGHRGGRARAARHSRAQLVAWARKGGRPRKDARARH